MERSCSVCGAALQKKPGKGRWPKRCDEHRRLRAPLTDTICPCGVAFAGRASRKWCSRRCQRRKYRTPQVMRRCDHCDSPFQTYAGSRRNYCSNRCRHRLASGLPVWKPEVAVCACGTAFLARWPRHKWCSKRCARENHGFRRRAQGALKGHDVATNREVIGRRDRWRCGLCGASVNRHIRWPDPESGSIDHIVPLSLGGSHEMGNLQLSHLRCNMKKGARVVLDAAA